MATVFTNDMVAHVWAQQKQAFGRTANGNFYFEGPTLYSYGRHYVVGFFTSDGTAWLNADSSTITTNGKHKGPAGRAVNWKANYAPGLTDLVPFIGAADKNGLLPVKSAAIASLAKYLAANWQRLGDDNESAIWILRAIRSRATWPAMRARFAALKAKADSVNAARAAKHLQQEARETAATPFKVWRRKALKSSDSRGLVHSAGESLSDLRALHRAVKPDSKAGKARKAELWRRIKSLQATVERLRALYSPYAQRERLGYHRLNALSALQSLKRAKAGDFGYIPGHAGLLTGQAAIDAALALPTGAAQSLIADLLGEVARLHMPPAYRRALEALRTDFRAIADSRRTETDRLATISRIRERVIRKLASINRARRVLADIETRPTQGDVTDRIKADWLLQVSEDSESLINAARGGDRNLADYAPLILARLLAATPALQMAGDKAREARAPLLDAMQREREAAREAERVRNAWLASLTRPELSAAWQAGEVTDSEIRRSGAGDSGPLLKAVNPVIDGCKVTGGDLVTSEGATVPLRHAFRVFQFVAHCRAKGKGWTPESGLPGFPRHIRVGHFALDRIDSSGDFKAGCHSIKWPEIARLAESLGVANCLAPLAEIAAESV